jgi:hypothetical protein
MWPRGGQRRHPETAVSTGRWRLGHPNICRITEGTGAPRGLLVRINTEDELLSFVVCQFFLRLKFIPETNW